jgi:predicted AlkP superfamily pyrophosphatase or phosphodiesterase
MMLPDYNGGSIVNLMGSILKSSGGRSQYTPLRYLSPNELSRFRNVVLFVVDGLGFDYVLKHPRSVFSKYLRAKMTSVFPPTTAAAITTFMTGLAPHNHGLTGWYVHFKEFGGEIAVLPFVHRYGGMPLGAVNPNASRIFDQKSVFDRIKVKSYMIQGADIIDSDYTRAFAGRAKRLSYVSMNGLFRQLKHVIKLRGKKFVYAYWPEFDHVCHSFGKKSREAKTHFLELDKKLASFIKSARRTNTLIVITADHGHIDTTPARLIDLNMHSALWNSLVLPASGEPRTAYCYVRHSKARQFEQYVRKKLKHACRLYKSADLVRQNWFGLFKPHPRLHDRIGDYTLIMRENYVVRQHLLGKEPHYHVGNHGGVSAEEMFVPLIVIKPG